MDSRPDKYYYKYCSLSFVWNAYYFETVWNAYYFETKDFAVKSSHIMQYQIADFKKKSPEWWEEIKFKRIGMNVQFCLERWP